MKFKHCSVQNFGSYKDFSIDFNNLGLVAVTGETGSGKSTILDMIPWILFGETSKDTKAEEVRTWGSDDPTTGELQIELSDATLMTVTRVRGGPSETDLYFVLGADPSKIRGKSILETQKLIESRLKISADLYFTSAYLHQFSKADTFFIARATDRREVFKKIVDQSLAIELADEIASRKKPLKVTILKDDAHLEFVYKSIATDNERLVRQQDAMANWAAKRDVELSELENLSTAFSLHIRAMVDREHAAIEEITTKLVEDPNIEKRIVANHKMYYEVAAGLNALKEQLSEIQKHGDLVCPTCLQTLPEQDKIDIPSLMQRINDFECILADESKKGQNLQHQRQLQHSLDEHRRTVTRLTERQDPHKVQVAALQKQTNPYIEQVKELTYTIKDSEAAHRALTKIGLQNKHELFLLETLQNLTLDLRGAILNNALSDLEKSTNHILSTYFDSEILIKFSLESSDKLELDIQKSGNPCSFRQLSGGQRCMLKLAFNLSLMALAENKAGVKFHTLMLDEPLTGLSDDLKIKAFSLFESLTKHYETIVVVEHSDALKACFNNKIVVTMVGDESKADFG